MDELTVQVEHAESLDDASVRAWADRISARLRTVLGVGANVVPVRRNTFERTEFKARRVIDDRDMLRQVSRSPGRGTP